MRFKLPTLPTLALLIAMAHALHLAIARDLDLYIHPRYIIFNSVMVVIGLLVVAIDWRDPSAEKSHDYRTATLVPLVVLLAAAMFLPARSLSSATFSQRTIGSGSVVTLSSSSQPLTELFASSSKGLKLIDWHRILVANSDPSYYHNKPAIISGFIHDAGLGPNAVWLSRFVVTCCAVDAQPIGIPVQLLSWESEYEADQWLKVEGEFSVVETSKGAQLVLVPETVEPIEEPGNPYAN